MKTVVAKIKPKQGYSSAFHIVLTLALPLIIFVLIQMRFVSLAVALLLLSKWRMFVVRPRYWLASIRVNAVDIIFGLSVITFMSQTNDGTWQLVWTALYAMWLIAIKPRSDILSVGFQAVFAQAIGLSAIFLIWSAAPLSVLVIASGLVGYAAARHFFTVFDEPYASLYAHSWAYFVSAICWVLGHWLLFYGALAQPTLLLLVISFSLASLYYLNHHDRLSLLFRRQIVFIACAVVVAILLFSDWGDRQFNLIVK